MRTSLSFCSLCCCSLIAVLGCGADDGRVEVYPISGEVLVKGQPAEGATVVFYPGTPESQDGKVPPPTGTVDATGGFRLTTFEPDDGAPAGEFKVTVVWPEPPPPNATGVFAVKDRLRGAFADPQRSKLTARVEPGGGELPPFELQ